MSSKTAIILLPGMDGTGELLKPLAERLAAHRPTWIIRYPVDRRLDYNQLTDFVGERLPTGRFVILGESFSGAIAIETAATNPCVAGLILASSFARHPLPTWLSRVHMAARSRMDPYEIDRGSPLGSGSDTNAQAAAHGRLEILTGRGSSSASEGGASDRQARPLGYDHLPDPLPAWQLGPARRPATDRGDPFGASRLRAAQAGSSAHAAGHSCRHCSGHHR